MIKKKSLVLGLVLVSLLFCCGLFVFANSARYAEMPDVTGLSVREAATLLEENGIINSQIPTYLFHDGDGQKINLSSTDYYVIEQIPKSGDKVIVKDGMVKKQTEVLDFLCSK